MVQYHCIAYVTICHYLSRIKSPEQYLKKNLYYIEVQLISSVVLVSGVQQSDSIVHIHLSILFQILFPFILLKNIEHSSLCYTVGPYRTCF